MAKNRHLSYTSTPRYRLKMYRLFGGQEYSQLALEVSDMAQAKWNEEYGRFHNAYLRMKDYILRNHPNVPVAQLGLYRSFLFKAMKEIPNGADPEDLINEFQKKAGLDTTIMREILALPDLQVSKSETEVTPKKG